MACEQQLRRIARVSVGGGAEARAVAKDQYSETLESEFNDAFKEFQQDQKP